MPRGNSCWRKGRLGTKKVGGCFHWAMRGSAAAAIATGLLLDGTKHAANLPVFSGQPGVEAGLLMLRLCTPTPYHGKGTGGLPEYSAET